MRWAVFGMVATVLAVAGCGASAPVRPVPPVRIAVTGPSDQATTLASSLLVRGTVAPAGTTVLVAGQPATVRGGEFAARVALAPGTNVIDVLAGAPRARGAVTAVRVYRELPVVLPDLVGQSPESAVARLRGLGLRAEVSDTSGFFQALVPVSEAVCTTAPGAGASLAPGTLVRVAVAKFC